MLDWKEILSRLLLAALFGALIGLERERKAWSAGLRTHMMVCVGSCLIMMVSAFGFSDILGTAHVELDPSRIAAQVVSGIGFIGAGTIMFQKQETTIRGLTTAAGLWTVAAIGLATGGGMYFGAAATTFIALIILWAIQPLEKIYSKKYKQRTLRICFINSPEASLFLNKIYQNPYLKIHSLSIENQNDTLNYLLKIDHTHELKTEQLLDEIRTMQGFKELSWI